ALTSLPPEIGLLTSMTELQLSRNRLTSLPPEIGLLTSLRELHLSGNRFTSLPPEIGRLTSLTGLDLSKNRLTSLPPETGQLTGLSDLKLYSNQLTSLPPEIGRLTNLRRLYLSRNPLTSPPPEVIKQGTRAILAYLREQLRGGVRQWVSKLLLVGEGAVGKTQLLRSLRGEPYDPELPTTHGIEIGAVELQHPDHDDVTMRLNSWDFGGQEIYHATHQFFLTNRSLFLLVWNARQGFEQGKLYYWLDTIQAKAPDSPVLIVATHIDERDADIPLADLCRKYPQVIGQCAVSNLDGRGIEELRRGTARAAADLPLMGETWPATWLKAAEAIRSRDERYVSPRQLWDIMAEHEVRGRDAAVLARWLHELGDILYFEDDEELKDTVVLKPQWVTEYISKALESGRVIDGLGSFTREHMDELWSDVHPSMRNHFLRLMERFDLSYRIPNDQHDRSLIVERLSFDPPDYQEAWESMKTRDSCSEITMKFDLNTTMPAGIPTWFIARSHRFTTYTHWRYGALFADGDERRHLGLIRAFPHDRYLQLTVRGPCPQNFFALLKDGLELTLARFPGLKIERLVPCPGHDGSECPFEFNLAHLEKAISTRPPVLEIKCQESFKGVTVPLLLFGIDWSVDPAPSPPHAEFEAVLARLDRMEGSIFDGQQV
ncbi:MAG: leucine-rich repeat domain-containing protein, partial [Armatimonadetes bacterium]|nr:leucine-rich repeat domain-containing protein [Armatimonadota bacterium]